MAHQYTMTSQTRKTRIICIADTHNQTPKLPKGDVLIHAGDMTKQGSYPELKRTVKWLEKTDFAAKIVIAGNHDLTLDKPFFEEHGSKRRWPQPQDPDQCKKLFVDSPSITYLEHEAAVIYLTDPKGPHTCFKVFGSPYISNLRDWAFGYKPSSEATVWEGIPLDSDIVVTHGPPRNHLDKTLKGDTVGCEALGKALHRVRPMLSVFGHIHESRGAERVHWNLGAIEGETLEESIQTWRDPGIGNKQSLVDLSAKGGRGLKNVSGQTRHASSSLPFSDTTRERDRSGQPQPDTLESTSRPEGVENEAIVKAMAGGAIEYRPSGSGDIGLVPDVELGERRKWKRETCLINAAFLQGHWGGGPKLWNKPIVVDIDLPVWTENAQAV